MATSTFRLKGKNIYLRFSVERGKVFERKTGLTINPTDWSNKKKQPIERDETLKQLKYKLEDLRRSVDSSYNSTYTKGGNIDSNWLQTVIDKFNNQDVNTRNNLTTYIQKVIDEAPNKKIPAKGGKYKVGLSEGRVKGLKQFLKIMQRFESEKHNGKPIDINKLNKKDIKELEDWLTSKSYSVNYIGKQLTNLKSVLNDAVNNDNDDEVKLIIRANDIKVVKEDKEPEDIIYLSFEELDTIKDLMFTNNYLENARKWLILGCYVGQRVGDLLNLSPANIKEINGRKVFQIRQEKTKKDIVIPILPEAQKIIDSGFPHVISQTKLREYFKKICKQADLNELKNGRIKESQHGATKKGTFPKWQLVGTHICRRSFASNYYGKIPTPLLIDITGHSTEKMFLNYIGKTSSDKAMMMFEYLERLPSTNKKPKLKIIRSTGTDNK